MKKNRLLVPRSFLLGGEGLVLLVEQPQVLRTARLQTQQGRGETGAEDNPPSVRLQYSSIQPPRAAPQKTLPLHVDSHTTTHSHLFLDKNETTLQESSTKC